MVKTGSNQTPSPAALQLAASKIGDVRSCTLINGHPQFILEMFDDRFVEQVVSHLHGSVLEVRCSLAPSKAYGLQTSTRVTCSTPSTCSHLLRSIYPSPTMRLGRPSLRFPQVTLRRLISLLARTASSLMMFSSAPLSRKLALPRRKALFHRPMWSSHALHSVRQMHAGLLTRNCTLHLICEDRMAHPTCLRSFGLHPLRCPNFPQSPLEPQTHLSLARSTTRRSNLSCEF